METKIDYSDLRPIFIGLYYFYFWFRESRIAAKNSGIVFSNFKIKLKHKKRLFVILKKI